MCLAWDLESVTLSLGANLLLSEHSQDRGDGMEMIRMETGIVFYSPLYSQWLEYCMHEVSPG